MGCSQLEKGVDGDMPVEVVHDEWDMVHPSDDEKDSSRSVCPRMKKVGPLMPLLLTMTQSL